MMNSKSSHEDATSRAERRKRDPIGQILDFLSNTSTSGSTDKSAVSSAHKNSDETLNSNFKKVDHNKYSIYENSAANTVSKQLCEEPAVLDENRAFKPFSRKILEIPNVDSACNNGNGHFLQKSLAMVNNYANIHAHPLQNLSAQVSTTSLYGLPGFPLQYPTIANTLPQAAIPKIPFMFPPNYGFYSNLDVSRNVSVFSWLEKKMSPERIFNPACILNSGETRSHVTQAPPRYQCDSCKKSYSTYGGLSKHKQFHCVNQVKKEFSCKFCGKCYGSLGALKMHIRTHTLPCKCKICGKAFSRPWLLQGHIRTHTGEKPFRCDHCSRAFADRSNLRAHLQTHSEVKKYGCKNCSKTFSRMSLLVKHKENHCYR